ncbi:wall-associated receptor kinase-like 14 [Punica granatum]|uniref:Wall-associated receptor kinase-like 14 n=1 Tax=Punica granatum TaxID=22663 RepID=A0A218W0Z0_PUNGR|nr:wall-associated receptor kinase-like 14 [Punica granatum]OWM66316.1 hypothetical protein CDL15_Pgr013533 [Punica granatum]
MLVSRAILIVLTAATIIPAPLISLTTAHNSTSCTRTCGVRTVRYPFGFSPGCPIRLNCINSTGDIKIDKFQVLDITQSSIFIKLPTRCNRSISSIMPLFGSNYSPTRTNGFILQNCKAPQKGCYEHTWFLDIGNCTENHKGDNVSCFSPDNKGADVIGYEALNTTGCKFIQSSIAAVDANSLMFKAVELAWWLKGSPHEICDVNVSIDNVTLINGTKGIRCKCGDGFHGDGFINGTPCWRALSGCSSPRYFSHHCGRTAKLGILMGGLVAGAFLISGLTVICYLILRHSISLRSRMSAKRLLHVAAGSTSVPLYTYKDIERATNGFSERQKLGNGAYGTVYGGILHNDEWVAIKRIRHRDADSIDKVANEIKLLSSVSHPNLVRLLGCCIEDGEQILVYEFMPNGTLLQHLMKERGTGLPWTVRLRIAAETARAIAYLHSETNPPIFHRDVKSNNILLDSQYNSKVADFGLSRLGMTEANDSHISTAPQGTPGYLDPQYHQQFHLSDKSDVYSFGVVLVEIITALKVIDFRRPHSEVNLAALALDRISRGCVDEIIDPSIDPHWDAWTLSSIHKVAELAFRCLAHHWDLRPSMTEVAEELELICFSGWAAPEDNMTCIGGSSVASSSCASPYGGSEKSFGRGLSAKKGGGSRRLSIQQYYRRPEYSQNSTGNGKDNSRISAHNCQLSDKSSPSAAGLLQNMVP